IVRPIWEEEGTRHDAPTVTSLGAVLRKLSLDELPQLINVLVGEMSLVGPRPVVDEEMRKYGRSGRHYLRVRPGVTGLWQISGRSDTGYATRVLLDRHYVMSWNVLLDIKVLVLTIPAVLFASGAR
ncbi:sugar transferase, partial [Thioclava sp.]|uniref:sugar transferase n=1 Tax=Thioclava sp. TaxID=1933450 RepID=UPI00324201CC